MAESSDGNALDEKETVAADADDSFDIFAAMEVVAFHWFRLLGWLLLTYGLFWGAEHSHDQLLMAVALTSVFLIAYWLWGKANQAVGWLLGRAVRHVRPMSRPAWLLRILVKWFRPIALVLAGALVCGTWFLVARAVVATLGALANVKP